MNTLVAQPPPPPGSQPFPSTTAMWSQTPTTKYIMEGDTTINSQNYKKLFVTTDSVYNGDNAVYFAAIREALPGGVLKTVFEGEVQEKLIYDFNRNLGDTVTVYNYDFGYELGTVIAVDSILIGQNYRRLLKVSFSGAEFEWISGIGSKSGLFFPGSLVLDYVQTLLCFEQEGQQLYENSPNGNCNFVLGINSLNQSQFRVFPNPASNQLKIEFPETSDELQLHVFNALGKRVLSEIISIGQSKIVIERQNLSSGLYSFRFERANQTIQSGKFIFQ